MDTLFDVTSYVAGKLELEWAPLSLVKKVICVMSQLWEPGRPDWGLVPRGTPDTPRRMRTTENHVTFWPQ